jgi:hypothetical protein
MPARRARNLQPGEIDSLLQELGNELIQRGFSSVQIMITGGAYMLLAVGSRPTTTDIDFFPLNFVDSSNPNQETRLVLQAIKAVAGRNNLKQDWANDAVCGILGWMAEGISQPVFWRKYGALEIFMPPEDFVLATKIFGFRDKDLNDVMALCSRLQVRTRAQAQAIVDRYVDRATQWEYNTHVALGELFDE